MRAALSRWTERVLGETNLLGFWALVLSIISIAMVIWVRAGN